MTNAFTAIITDRLLLRSINEKDGPFMNRLLNSPGWLQFIGDRKVRSDDEAVSYIRKIQSDININYWVAVEQESGQAVGVFTFIRREYLDHYDIGYALLPSAMGKGLAAEGARALLNEMIKTGAHRQVLATVVPDNEKSCRLLTKLGLSFHKSIEVAGEELHVYAIDVDTLR